MLNLLQLYLGIGIVVVLVCTFAKHKIYNTPCSFFSNIKHQRLCFAHKLKKQTKKTFKMTHAKLSSGFLDWKTEQLYEHHSLLKFKALKLDWWCWQTKQMFNIGTEHMISTWSHVNENTQTCFSGSSVLCQKLSLSLRVSRVIVLTDRSKMGSFSNPSLSFVFL